MLLTPIGNVVLVNIIPALQFFPVDRTKQVNMLIASDVSETERRRGKPEVDKSIRYMYLVGKLQGAWMRRRFRESTAASQPIC